MIAFTGPLSGQTLGSLNERADGIQSKAWSGSQWSGGSSRSGHLKKSFPIQEWGKRYSSLGSQRAGGVYKQRYDKKIYQKQIKSYDTWQFDMAQWNDYVSSIHERSAIQTDQRSKKISDRALYHMILQDTRSYRDLGERVSLRDINRFQFRRNRSDGDIPVERVDADQ
ncbi:MAG: hypothetical protein AAF546_07450 [Verrucomicrobiota bacterium]